MNRGYSRTMTLMVLVFIVGGVIGFALRSANGDARSSTNGTTNNEPTTTTTPAANVRTNLNAALRQHAALALPVMQSVLANDETATAAQEAMEKNTQEVAIQVNAVFPGKKDEFVGLWREHLRYYVGYAKAAQASDQAKMAEARRNLAGFADRAAGWFAAQNDQIDKEKLDQGLVMHSEQTLEMIDALNEQDHTAAYTVADEAYRHMGSMAEMLAEAGVAASPDTY